MRQRWEHLTIDWRDGDSWQEGKPQTSLDAMLNDQGDSGWELVAVVPLRDEGWYRYAFKQPLPSD